MAERRVDRLIIGAGPAGVTCAAELREAGDDGTILLVNRDPDPPYDRTACSKGYLRGDSGRDDVPLRDPGWWDEAKVELQAGASVMKLDAERRVATLSTKEEVAFEHALLATGANVRRLPIEGAQLDGVHFLRTLRNADAIRADAEGAEDVVLIGGSFIGTEVAATLTGLGVRCTILMQEEVVLERPFGKRAGAYLEGVLRDHGVAVHGGEEVGRLVAAADDSERVGAVVTKAGRELAAGAVVIGAGVQPDVMLARAAGLELGETGGVRCDSRLRTSADGIFAAGDVCEYDSVVHGRQVRVEHWEVAIAQGKTAARNMLGADRAHEEIPYFFSDFADWCSLEYVGPAPDGWDEEVVRGSVEDGEFSLWYLLRGRVVGALSVERSADLDHARRLIAAGTDVSGRREVLADPGAELGGL